ncbi:flagellar motor control protein ZomB [Nocardia colli]|uniref:flagellar motor control protein ZomB n=1 Tax=Nocardia colli TaxID=2545717 RepID=UPI0035DF674B
MTLTLSPDLVVGEELVAVPARRPSRTVFVSGMVFTAVLFAIGGWQRRWIADDGLTVLRTVRNLLAGNGPVFNAGERVEVNTSTAWTYLVWFFSWLTQARLEYVVLGIALTLSVAAIVFAMLGTARLWGGGVQLLLPAGALVYIAVPPARDYATSGLESSLVICWIAVLWWGLIRWSRAEKTGYASILGLSFVAGLAPLIRPELTLLGTLALLMICGAPQPGIRLRPWIFRALVAATAGLVPVAYQIWRMGYYALPYPNTAVAKDAGGAKWRQGLVYLWNLIGPYWLWVPLMALGVAAVLAVRSRRIACRAAGLAEFETKPDVRERLRRFSAWLRTPAAVVALMLGSGVLLTVYEIRVGGDFMHGRMLLPPLFCVLLPVMVLPLKLSAARADSRHTDRAFGIGALAVTAGWALLAANATALENGRSISTAGIADEHLYYVQSTGHEHPLRAEDYLDYPRMRTMIGDLARNPNGGLLINSPSWNWQLVPPPTPNGGAGHTVYFINLGMISMNVPLDVRVLDPMGLSYPLAAHTFRFPNARIGHDKNLDSDWAVVDAGMANEYPGLPWFIDEGWVARIRTAMNCPATRDLLASTRAPLTADRFQRNIQQSLRYAKYRIDRVPEFEIERCQVIDRGNPGVPR